MKEPERDVANFRPTERFTSKAREYALFRPHYPASLILLLRERAGLRPGMVVADIGSGTGILTAQLLDEGASVYAVEPNEAMRRKAEEDLGTNWRFHSVAARAEATTLPSGSTELVTIAQAFHWFDLPPTRVEFLRILKPEGHLCLVWNSRDPVGGEFEAGYNGLVEECCPAAKKTKDLGPTEEEIARFYGGEFLHTFLPNHQDLDREGLKGRFMSASYAPDSHEPSYVRAMSGLEKLFYEHVENGTVRLHYRTEVYLGRLSRD
ncbi:MAG: hypothetical protein A4E32_00060 [Methanomassiliicoccales archaeon PtaU1.Bin124]|nr:MAG: hypothetical protein A4E32_00060 [Methanomassiliicoccales archaeon PtaU1.Bin124]